MIKFWIISPISSFTCFVALGLGEFIRISVIKSFGKLDFCTEIRRDSVTHHTTEAFHTYTFAHSMLHQPALHTLSFLF